MGLFDGKKREMIDALKGSFSIFEDEAYEEELARLGDKDPFAVETVGGFGFAKQYAGYDRNKGARLGSVSLCYCSDHRLHLFLSGCSDAIVLTNAKVQIKDGSKKVIAEGSKDFIKEFMAFFRETETFKDMYSDGSSFDEIKAYVGVSHGGSELFEMKMYEKFPMKPRVASKDPLAASLEYVEPSGLEAVYGLSIATAPHPFNGNPGDLTVALDLVFNDGRVTRKVSSPFSILSGKMIESIEFLKAKGLL